jgi:type VI secretion system protein VasJ
MATQLKRIGAVLRDAKPDDPLAYRYGRMGQWLPVAGSPPTPAGDGKTLVPPPPPHLKQRFETLVQTGDWLTLLREADNIGAEQLLWLDPQRYVATAMGALGVTAIKAREELLLQVALFLKRVPNLPKLSFSDGTPLADGPTQMWIDSDVAPVLGGGDGGGGGGGGGAALLAEPIKEARGLAVKGELSKAVDLVTAAASAAPTPSDRFRGRLAVAQLCLQAGKYSIARGQLEGLAEIIGQHHLTTWDPWLCAEVYSGLFSSHKAMNDALKPKPNTPVIPGMPPPGPSAEALAEQRRIFDQLCQLDPAEALKLAGNKK